MRLSRRIRHALTVMLARLLTRWLNSIPRDAALFCGSVLGLAAWQILARDRYQIGRHLSLVYPDMSAPERHRISRDFFVNSGRNMVDVIRFQRHYQTEIKPLVTVEGLEHFDQAYRKGKGLIGITGHLGNFELLAVHMAALGYRIAVIGREMYEQRLDELLVGNREAMGLTNIYTSDSPRQIISWLQRGGAVGVLIDIDSKKIRSIYVPVMGRPALTPVGQSLIGLKTGAAFVPMVCIRTPDDRYKIIIKPEVTIEPTGDKDRDVYLMTAACSREVEDFIDQYRDQWVWLKNRWATSPEKYP